MSAQPQMTGYRWAKMNKTQQLYNELMSGARKKNKYGAKKQRVDGHAFDSKAEAKRYGELKLLEKAGEIHFLEVHPQYHMYVKGLLIAAYKADFGYRDRLGRQHVEDVKGGPTAKRRDFILIRKLMKACLDIDVEIVGSPALRSIAVGKAA